MKMLLNSNLPNSSQLSMLSKINTLSKLMSSPLNRLLNSRTPA